MQPCVNDKNPKFTVFVQNKLNQMCSTLQGPTCTFDHYIDDLVPNRDQNFFNFAQKLNKKRVIFVTLFQLEGHIGV